MEQSAEPARPVLNGVFLVIVEKTRFSKRDHDLYGGVWISAGMRVVSIRVSRN
jgi:hypothetical protein